MDLLSITLGICFTVANTLLALAAVPLVLGRIPRNTFYGVRLPLTLKSDKAWYTVNRYAGVRMIVFGVLGAALGGFAFATPMQSHPMRLFGVLGAQFMMVLLLLVDTMLFVRRFKKLEEDGG